MTNDYKETMSRANETIKKARKELAPYKPVSSLVAQVHHDMLFTDPASRGVQTGLSAIDNMGGCFRRQDLIVIAGRPSMGKTALAVSILRNMAKSGIPSLIFSLEMSKEQLVERLLCQEKDACMHDITRRKNHEHNVELISKAAQPVSELPIWIDETGGLTVESFEERLKQAIEDLGIKCVFIDYLQLMNTVTKSPERENAYIGHITRNLKRIAKDNDIPIVLLAQVNRQCEYRTNKRPVKADLKGSGDIEQDADVIIFLYRDEEYNPASEDKGTAEAIFAKYRNGKTGIVKLTYLSESMRFADLADRWDV
jgi:replicative DNA helicase